jgi:hypothetical protein
MNVFLLMTATLIIIGAIVVTMEVEDNIFPANPKIILDNNINTFGYMQHQVEFHIEPPIEGAYITIIDPSNNIKFKATDSNGNAVFEMDPISKYSVVVPERNISVVMYPTEYNYILYGERK